MQSHRFKTLIAVPAVSLGLAVSTVLSAPAAFASGPSGSASQAEKIGCQSSGYRTIDTWDLMRGGTRYPGIGYGQILWRPSPSHPNRDIRVCAITKHGYRTWGDKLVTDVEVGTQPHGGGEQIRHFWDDGLHWYYTQGRAITPAQGRCAVIHIKMIGKYGKVYSRWIGQFNMPDKYICN